MICPRCNTLNNDSKKKCDRCGYSLSKTQTNQPKNLYKTKGVKSGKSKSIFKLLLIVLLFLSIVCLFYNYSSIKEFYSQYPKANLVFNNIDKMIALFATDSLNTDTIVAVSDTKPEPQSDGQYSYYDTGKATNKDKGKDTLIHKTTSNAKYAQKIKKKAKINKNIYYGKDNKKMRKIPQQTFVMGSDKGPIVSKPAHKVKVNSFYMDVYEVTNGEYKRFMKATSYIPEGDLIHFDNKNFNDDRQPVVNISYNDAKAYAAWAGKRLPSEKEWECVARGGKGYSYATGDTITQKLANYGYLRGKGKTRRVGSFPPNPYGIYDLCGNASEWIWDYFMPYPGSEEGVSKKNIRMMRGGSWKSFDNDIKVYDRTQFYSNISDNTRGFRCVISASQVKY